MEIRGSLSPPRLTTETSVALSSLKLGAVLSVRVEAQVSTQRYLLKLLPGGESLTARAGLDLQPGKVVQLEVVRLGKEPELRLSTPEPTPSHAEAIPNALLRLLPRQATVADAATPVAALLKGGEQLPPGIAQVAKSLLASLPTSAQLSTPAGLKAAVADSGQFFEARLAEALAQGRDFPHSDLKGQLLRLVAALSKPNSRPVADGGAKQPVNSPAQAKQGGSPAALADVASELSGSTEEKPTASVAQSAVSSQPSNSAPRGSGESPTETSTDVPAQPTGAAGSMQRVAVHVADAGTTQHAAEVSESLLPEPGVPRSAAESPPSATNPALSGRDSAVPVDARAIPGLSSDPEVVTHATVDTRLDAADEPGLATSTSSAVTGPALGGREPAVPAEALATPDASPDAKGLGSETLDTRLVRADEQTVGRGETDSTPPREMERATAGALVAPTGEAPVAKPHDLQAKLEGALARLTIDQLAAQQSQPGLSWRFDLPYLDGDQPGSARLDVRAEDQGGVGGAARRVWSVNLELEPPGLGRFVARILWDGDKVDSYLWSDRDTTGELIKTYSDHLRARLEEAGLRVGRVEQPARRPETQPASLPREPLLDLTA